MKVLLLLVAALACTAQAQNLTASVSNITSPSDALSFILNLKYLQAQFYTFAVNGSGLDATLLGFANGTVSNLTSALNITTLPIPSAVNSTLNATSFNKRDDYNSWGGFGGWGGDHQGLDKIIGGEDKKDSYGSDSQPTGGSDKGYGHEGDKLAYLNKDIGKLGKYVEKDVLTQQQFLDKFHGGKLAQLTWFVQQIADQLAWGEVHNIASLQGLLGGLGINLEAPELTITDDIFNTWMVEVMGDETWKGGYSPYYDDISFVLAAFFFESIIVEAEYALLPLVEGEALELLGSILALDAAQLGVLRGWLYANGPLPCTWFSKYQVIDVVQKISDWIATIVLGLDCSLTKPHYEHGSFWIPKVSKPDYKFIICPTDLKGILTGLTSLEVSQLLQLFYPVGIFTH